MYTLQSIFNFQFSICNLQFAASNSNGNYTSTSCPNGIFLQWIVAHSSSFFLPAITSRFPPEAGFMSLPTNSSFQDLPFCIKRNQNISIVDKILGKCPSSSLDSIFWNLNMKNSDELIFSIKYSASWFQSQERQK